MPIWFETCIIEPCTDALVYRCQYVCPHIYALICICTQLFISKEVCTNPIGLRRSINLCRRQESPTEFLGLWQASPSEGRNSQDVYTSQLVLGGFKMFQVYSEHIHLSFGKMFFVLLIEPEFSCGWWVWQRWDPNDPKALYFVEMRHVCQAEQERLGQGCESKVPHCRGVWGSRRLRYCVCVWVCFALL